MNDRIERGLRRELDKSLSKLKESEKLSRCSQMQLRIFISCITQLSCWLCGMLSTCWKYVQKTNINNIPLYSRSMKSLKNIWQFQNIATQTLQVQLHHQPSPLQLFFWWYHVLLGHSYLFSGKFGEGGIAMIMARTILKLMIVIFLITDSGAKRAIPRYLIAKFLRIEEILYFGAWIWQIRYRFRYLNALFTNRMS